MVSGDDGGRSRQESNEPGTKYASHCRGPLVRSNRKLHSPGQTFLSLPKKIFNYVIGNVGKVICTVSHATSQLSFLGCSGFGLAFFGGVILCFSTFMPS
jgi:hypothetical protein